MSAYVWAISPYAELLQELVKCMCVVIRKEAKQLSSHFSICSSMLSTNNIVSWVEAIPEFKAKAPCLSEMLKACVTNPQNQNVFAVALAVLMKGRWSHACFMQKIVSLILYMGHANKHAGISNL